jgi:hypothetical protein
MQGAQGRATGVVQTTGHNKDEAMGSENEDEGGELSASYWGFLVGRTAAKGRRELGNHYYRKFYRDGQK